MSCCAASVAVPEYMQETIARNERLEQERLLAASVKLGPDRYKCEFIVPGMHCAGCIGTIERGLAELEALQQVRANLSMKTVTVIWDTTKGDITEVPRKLDALGFDHHLGEADGEIRDEDKTGRTLLLSLAVAGFAAANIMLLSVSVWSGADQETAQLFHLLSGLIAIPAVAFAGRPFFRSAAKAISAGRLNMDVPISLAVLLALGMSTFESLTGGEEAYFDASVTLLFFLLIGRYLDHLMRQKARGAVERLSSLSAKDGVLIGEDGNSSHIALKEIEPGMRLRVFAGERFPVNGRIVSGSSDLDRSHVTGESDSVLGVEGDLVEAGTLNLTASVDYEATTSADTSFLAEMRKMMEAAEQSRSKYVRIADRMARIYAPAVHLLAAITFVAWMIVSAGDWHTSLYTAIAVLIVTCPCALGLAVPVAHVIGANRLMQNGILMRDGTALERLATTDHVTFDKTGTLTKGTPLVVGVHGLNDQVLPGLAAATAISSHPVTKAIRHYLGDCDAAALDSATELPGFGIEAEMDGRMIRLGKPEWVAEISADTIDDFPKGCSACFAIEGSKAICFEIEDEIRQDANKAIGELAHQSVEMEILSGDAQPKVARLARALNIKNFLFGQTPADKIEHVNRLRSEGKKVLMVGDGINDAPALAAGHVSMVPASASDVGRHAADFVFTRPSLRAIPIAFGIAKFTDRIVRQNFGLAIAYNCIAVPLAMAGFVTPLIAAIAMSASSILVVANSFRINLVAANNDVQKQSGESGIANIAEVTA